MGITFRSIYALCLWKWFLFIYFNFEYKSKTAQIITYSEMNVETKLNLFEEYFMSLKFLEGLYAPWKAVGKPNHSRSHMLIDGIFSLILIRNRLKVGTWSQGFVLVCRLSCHLSCQSQYGFSKRTYYISIHTCIPKCLTTI